LRELKERRPESEYEVVDFGDYWGVLSLLLFGFSLAARAVVGLLPPRLQGYYSMPPLAVLLVPLLSGLGLLIALPGLRAVGRNALARAGLLLNAVVFILGSLVVIAIYLWVRR
jgi:hypothetical protein